jgi:hypothetical protein
MAANFVTMVNTSSNGLSNLLTAYNSTAGSGWATACSSNAACIWFQTKLCGSQGNYTTVQGSPALSGFSFGASALSGGSCAITWTNKGAGNGQTALGLSGGTSGIIGDNVYFAAWVADHAYGTKSYITDSNENIQEATTGGTSKSGTHPTWNTTKGGTTTDGTVTWTNEGPGPTLNLYLGAGVDGATYTSPGLQ